MDRFALLDLDDKPAPYVDTSPYVEEPTIETEPVQIPQVDTALSTWDAPVLNETARDLAAKESEVLARHGIGEGDLFYATGTALADVGHSTMERYADEYAALPSATEAVRALRETIAKEDRRDTICDLAGYRVDADGRLAAAAHVAGGKGVNIEPNAWKQLAAIAGSPNVNAGLSRRSHANRRVRARGPREDRSVFAIVSADEKRGYAVLDAPEVADLVLQGLRDVGQGDAKAEVKYDPESTRYRIRALVQAPVDIMAHRGVGRVHRVFLDVRGGDNGETSICGQMGVLRIRCLNASLAQTNGTAWSRIHRGSSEAIRAFVADMCGKWSVVAEEMRSLWARASAEHYLDSETGLALSPQEAITRLVGNGLLPTGGLTTEAAIDAYVAAWHEEEGVNSAAGVIMAIQRAAHETTWRTKWATDEIESAASGLLYQHVYTLDEVTA